MLYNSLTIFGLLFNLCNLLKTLQLFVKDSRAVFAFVTIFTYSSDLDGKRWTITVISWSTAFTLTIC